MSSTDQISMLVAAGAIVATAWSRKARCQQVTESEGRYFDEERVMTYSADGSALAGLRGRVKCPRNVPAGRAAGLRLKVGQAAWPTSDSEG